MSTVNFNDTTPVAPSDGSVNMRWQSDASGNVSANLAPGTWQTWTPTFTLPGGMTYSALTMRYARWNRIGNIGYVQLNFQLTLGGTAANFFTASFPLDVTDTQYQALAGMYGTSAALLQAIGAGIQSTGAGASNLLFSQTTNFTLTTLVFMMNGPFRIGT